MKNPEKRFVEKLSSLGLKVCFGESVTCGAIVNNLCSVKGVMDVLIGGIVCYHPSCKETALRVPSRLIRKCTPESPEVTKAVASGLTELFKADIYAAITGLAAPGGSETPTKPVGTIFFAVRYKRKTYELRKLFRGSPREIRDKASEEMLRFILRIVTGS